MIVLVIGGTRSGKSRTAEARAAAIAEASGAAGLGSAAVTYLATARVDPRDPGHQERVAAHQVRRPSTWTTVECGAALAPALVAHPVGIVLVDSLGSWIAAHADLDADVDGLVHALRSRQGSTVVVAEEVGLSVHPTSPVARRFVDRLGAANQAVAAVADEVLLVVAGRTLTIEST